MCKVSIIVPVHNTEQYLPTTVESLLAQTYKNIEIILVENASTDGSLALSHALADKYDRIKVIHTDIAGPANARNMGIDAATGEYIGFVDSDDTVDPDMYEKMIEISIEKDLDIVLCDFVKKYDYRSDRFEYINDGKITIDDPMEFLKKNFKNQIPQSACTLLCRKELFTDVRFPIGRYFEDTATTWRLLVAAKSAGHIARPFYHYYRHGGSIVHTSNFQIHYGHVLADIERVDFINEHTAYTDAEKTDLGGKSIELFCKHLKKMVALAKTEEEKQACLESRKWLLNLPVKYRLRLKYRFTYMTILQCWCIFCLLRRKDII